MSVLFDFGRENATRRRSILVVLALGALGCFGSFVTLAQEDSVETLAEVAADRGDLWTRVTERYEVVVLSRGLLLEPLDDSVEILTIEVVDDRVAIDGESMEESELREQMGDETAELVLELAAMDRTNRRLLFEAASSTSVVVAAGENDESDEAPDRAGRDERQRTDRRYSDSQIAVGNSLTVSEDEVAKEAVVFGGPLFVRGKVAGDAVAVGGSVTVSGEVTGDVTAVGGNLTLEAGAEVFGDAVSVGGRVDIDDEAEVRGQIIEVPFGANLNWGAWPAAIFGGRHGWRADDDLFELSPWGIATDFMWEAFKLILLALFACLFLLVAREPMERVQRRAAAEPWKSGLVGLLVQILFLPLLVLVTLILVVSIIGIPLVLLVPFFILALMLVAFLGYSGVAMGIGQFLRDRFGWNIDSPYLVLLLGVLTIQVLSIVGELLDFGWGPIWFFAVMFGVLGALVKYFAWTIGLGAAVLSRFGTADGWGSRQRVIAPSEPPGPAPGHSQPSEPRDPREPSVLRDLGFADKNLSASTPDVEESGTEDGPPSTRDL